jgi:excinuclease UvrABC nuclease subunit
VKTLDEIEASAANYAGMAGIYFLFKGKDLVYVGQSVDVYARLRHHRGGGFKYDAWWDRWAMIECQRGELDAMENAYILALRPRYNQLVRKDGVLCRLSAA